MFFFFLPFFSGDITGPPETLAFLNFSKENLPGVLPGVHASYLQSNCRGGRVWIGEKRI